MLEVQPAMVSIGGVKYFMELGTVTSFDIGFEDHGIFAWNVGFDFGSGVQGTGWRGFGNGPDNARPIKEVLTVLGLGRVALAKGARVYALRQERYGPIQGLMNLDQDKYLLFWEMYKDMGVE